MALRCTDLFIIIPSQSLYGLTLKAPITTAADDIFFFFFYFSEKKQVLTFRVNLADDSHEIPRFVFSEKKKKKKK